MPGLPLPFQPRRFSTTSTSSIAPSQNSAQERPARPWPSATRECPRGPATAPRLLRAPHRPVHGPQQGPAFLCRLPPGLPSPGSPWGQADRLRSWGRAISAGHTCWVSRDGGECAAAGASLPGLLVPAWRLSLCLEGPLPVAGLWGGPGVFHQGLGCFALSWKRGRIRFLRKRASLFTTALKGHVCGGAAPAPA